MSEIGQTQQARDFHEAMITLYDRAKEATNGAYRPVRFLQAVRRHGGLTYAKQSLRKRDVQAGLERLRDDDRLDISLESLVLDPKWSSLFTAEELSIARQRLAAAEADRPSAARRTRGREIMMDWVVEAIGELGGSAIILDIAKTVWHRHEHEIRQIGDLLYEWQYELRWAGDLLRREGLIRSAALSARGTWELVEQGASTAAEKREPLPDS